MLGIMIEVLRRGKLTLRDTPDHDNRRIRIYCPTCPTDEIKAQPRVVAGDEVIISLEEVVKLINLIPTPWQE